MRFEIYEEVWQRPSDTDWTHEWRWRLRARNGRIVADGSEGYATKAGVKRALWRVNEAFIYAGRPLEVVEVES